MKMGFCGVQRAALRLLAAAVMTIGSLTPVIAQGFPPAAAPPWVYADNFGRWGLPIQSPNVYTFSPTGICYVTQLNYTGKQFYAFGNTVALAPVLVQDVNQANSEIVTPGSFLTPTSISCGPSLAPANSHKVGTILASGSGGLQEAINSIGASTAPALTTIVISQEWYKLIAQITGQNATLTQNYTPADVITNATCSSLVSVVDVTTAPWTWYNCNASNKLIVSTPQPAVSVAAGAGAGTSPTIAIEAGSSQGQGTITLTTGTTPTASAAIFTVTFSAPDYGGGFRYAPSCTVTSVSSTEAYTSGTVSSTAGSGTSGGTLVLTASATALTASQAGYKWRYSCH